MSGDYDGTPKNFTPTYRYALVYVTFDLCGEVFAAL